MNRIIKQVTVLGSGVMGSRIACHFAGIGLQVWLLDIAPTALTEQERNLGRTLDQAIVRNRIVQEAFQAALHSSPSPIYRKDLAANIRLGNFSDDLGVISNCDWVIEVVVENMEIKKSVFAQVEKYRQPGTLVTSNTSGIPIHLLTQGRSADFCRFFCGTHFFNPPRYLRLLEIIPTPETDPEVTDFLIHYGDLFLGKTTVLCKDTPAFIANRIGVVSILSIFRIMEKLSLTIDEVDALTGPLMGRPKSATFRTSDVVGIDTLVKVANGLKENCPLDEARDVFALPGFLTRMVENHWLGDKTGQGFYKKVNTPAGKQILTLNLQSLEYVPKNKVRFSSLESAKNIEDLRQRMKALMAAEDKAGEFYRQFYFQLFSYVSFRIPEIAEHPFQVDEAMKAGFGWELGPFETWDLFGVSTLTDQMEKAGYRIAPWVYELLKSGSTSFYRQEKDKRMAYSIPEKGYLPIPGSTDFIILDHLSQSIVWKNKVCWLKDVGQQVLCLQWQTKMNTIGGEVLEGVNQAIQLAEKNYRGLILCNEGINFSAGANVGLIFMLAAEQEFEELDLAVRLFQQTSMRIRYSGIPVLVAPHGLTLGGGCEFCLHADQIIAAAETYIGLVELGVGLIPGGGGTKEFTLRASDAYFEGDIQLPTLQNRFLTIALAKVSTSAQEAVDLGILRRGKDEVVIHPQRVLMEARQQIIRISEKGYTPAIPRKDIQVLGRTALGPLLTGINGTLKGNYISPYDALVARKLAFVMSGGDLSEASRVSESYLLDLEREAFLSLCGERKTLERLQSVLQTGKPIRN
ncbi:MAG: 3-hydroxyacyl-CoA dehydrogenase NAD-binding domain-containing protein [Chitinophagaceae bacterium]